MTASKPRLLVTRRIYEPVLDRLAQTFALDHNQAEDRPHAPAELARRLAQADYLFSSVADQITAEMLDQAPHLKLIANGGVGVNNIDLQACQARGIRVSNTPDVLTETTADFGWALLMATARRIPEADRVVRRGEWTGWAFDQLTGVDLFGASLGILGMGRIGSAIARRAQGFRMTVRYHNRSRAADEAGAAWVGLDELLAESDFLVVVVPYGPETHHLINAQRLAQMKPSACLVNIARGGVVDDEALVQALVSGQIRAAGLDVFEGEPRLNPGFMGLENVVLTPHIASASRDTRGAMMTLAADNLLAHWAGRPLITPVV